MKIVTTDLESSSFISSILYQYKICLNVKNQVAMVIFISEKLHFHWATSTLYDQFAAAF